MAGTPVSQPGRPQPPALWPQLGRFPGGQGALAQEGGLGPASEVRRGASRAHLPRAAPLPPGPPFSAPDPTGKTYTCPKAREGKGWLPRGTMATFFYPQSQRPVVWMGAPWPPLLWAVWTGVRREGGLGVA